MMDQSAAFDEKLSDFIRQIEVYISTYWRLRQRASRAAITATVVSIVLGAAVSVAGLLGAAQLSGVLGILLTSVIALEQAFAFSLRSHFYHSVHDDAKVLRDRLRYQVSSPQQLDSLVNEFVELRRRAVGQLPRGAVPAMKSNGVS